MHTSLQPRTAECRHLEETIGMQSQIDALAAEALGEAESAAEHYSFWAETVRRLIRQKLALLGLILTVGLVGLAIAAPLIAPHDPIEQFDSGLSDAGAPLPSDSHFLLGTDSLGRD